MHSALAQDILRVFMNHPITESLTAYCLSNKVELAVQPDIPEVDKTR